MTRLYRSLQYNCDEKENYAVNQQPAYHPSFTIYEPFYGSSIIYPTDTIVTYQATFAANDTYDSYSWTVGDDPTIHTSKSFTLTFPLSSSGNTLLAKLIASKNGKSDTFVKPFTIYAVKGTSNEGLTPFSLNLPYLGNFEGSYEDAPSHKFIVTITNLDTSSSAGFKGFRVLNLPEGCGGKYISGQPCVLDNISPLYYSYSFDYTYKAFFVQGGDELGCCPPVTLYGSIDTVNFSKIIIDCTFLNNDPNKVTKRKFIGFRL